MSNKIGNSTEKSEDIQIFAKIKAELRKVKPIFKNIGEEKKPLVDRQVQQLAFLQVTLDRLVEKVNTTDILEDFVQGEQCFKRENSALRSYNTTIKSYLAVSKQLCDLLPPEDKLKAGEALMQFITTPPPLLKINK
jgi:hypothetical protein